MNASQRWIVAELDALKRLQAETAAELDALLPAILDRAWTHSPLARSGFALSLREMDSFTPVHSALQAFVQGHWTNSFQRYPNASSHLARSQRACIKGEL